MSDLLPVGIYARFLQCGRFERACRESGLGLIEAIPLVSLLAPTRHVLEGYVSEARNARFAVSYDWSASGPLITHTYDTPVGTASSPSVHHCRGFC